MNFIKPLELVWSLIVTNIFLIVLVISLAVYLFKIRKRQTYLFYRRNIRKPFREVQDAISTSLKSKDPSTPEQLFIFHNASFNVSDSWNDPYTNTSLLSASQKLSICKKKIESIKKKIEDYYIYTNGRIKPEDLFELIIYKQELEKNTFL